MCSQTENPDHSNTKKNSLLHVFIARNHWHISFDFQQVHRADLLCTTETKLKREIKTNSLVSECFFFLAVIVILIGVSVSCHGRYTCSSECLYNWLSVYWKYSALPKQFTLVAASCWVIYIYKKYIYTLLESIYKYSAITTNSIASWAYFKWGVAFL